MGPANSLAVARDGHGLGPYSSQHPHTGRERGAFRWTAVAGRRTRAMKTARSEAITYC
jgi:hypothetical protein